MSTPKSNYESMSLPELHSELDKFGVKPFGRKRAFTDDQVAAFLDQSDFDDSGGEEDYIPATNDDPSSDSGDENAVGIVEVEQGDLRLAQHVTPRGRGRPGRGRGRVNNVSTNERTNHVPSQVEWVENNEFQFTNSPVTQPAYLPTASNQSKFDYVKLYIDDNIYQLITDKSNQNFVRRTGRSLNLTIQETKTFFGITLLMACINYPILRMYWEKNWRTDVVANAMSRDRFFAIRSSLKVVYDDDINNEEREKDKLWKVRPLIDSILNGCLKQVPEQQTSIDEMIVPFSGTCGIKQYCPNKPNPVGLKAFVLADPDGLVCNFTIYQGKTTFPSYTDNGFGLGESAVLQLTEILAPGSIVYQDRYFSTIKLAKELLSRGIKCAGTIMKNRIPAGARDSIESDLSLKRKGRGSYQVLTNNNSIALTKWMDNKPVLMLSTAHAACETDECTRWCKKDRRYIQVTRPEVIKEYNSKMGGVDMIDRLLAVCPSRARTKKWTVRLISHMFDLSICNAWLQFKKYELIRGVPLKKIQQLRFYKMQFAESLIEENRMVPRQEASEGSNEVGQPLAKRPPGRPGAVPIPSKRLRQNGCLHLPEVLDKQSRCRRKACDKKSTIKCKECNVALCLTASRNCFEAFHLEE